MELVKSSKKDNFLFPFWSNMFDADRFFDNRFPLMEPAFSVPPSNVIENEHSFKIELAAPGFSKDDLVINVDGDFLSIRAEKEQEQEEEEGRYTRKEFRYESFERSFILPQMCDNSQIDAHYTDGILTLMIPKKEEALAQSKKKIEVK